MSLTVPWLGSLLILPAQENRVTKTEGGREGEGHREIQKEKRERERGKKRGKEGDRKGGREEEQEREERKKKKMRMNRSRCLVHLYVFSAYAPPPLLIFYVVPRNPD